MGAMFVRRDSASCHEIPPVDAGARLCPDVRRKVGMTCIDAFVDYSHDHVCRSGSVCLPYRVDIDVAARDCSGCCPGIMVMPLAGELRIVEWFRVDFRHKLILHGLYLLGSVERELGLGEIYGCVEFEHIPPVESCRPCPGFVLPGIFEQPVHRQRPELPERGGRGPGVGAEDADRGSALLDAAREALVELHLQYAGHHCLPGVGDTRNFRYHIIFAPDLRRGTFLRVLQRFCGTRAQHEGGNRRYYCNFSIHDFQKA